MRKMSNALGSPTKVRPVCGRSPEATLAELLPTDSGANNAFVVAVEVIYEAALDPSHWPRALQAIADCLADIGAILLWRRDDGSFGAIASRDVLEAQKDWEQDGWNVRDLRPLRTAERGYFFSGEPFTDSHLFSDEEIRTFPSYTQFQVRHDLGWFGAVAVSPDPQVSVVLSVHRCARKRPPFSNAELAIVARLGRHVEKSLRLSIRLFDSELQKLGLAEALTRVGAGVFLLDTLGRVVFVNPAGKRLLGDGLEVGGDRLLRAATPARVALKTAIEQFTCAKPQDIAADHKPILVHRQKAERPLVVYVLPIAQSSHPAAQFLSQPRAIVLAIDAEARSPVDPALVRDILGLTLGEARVAALVGTGQTPRDAAHKLGISEDTVRTVLKNVFSKTDVSRQSELVSLLSRMTLH